MISNEPKQIVYDKSRTVALVLYILVESLDRAERTCMSAIIDTQSYCVKLDWQWSRHICLKDMSGLGIANNFLYGFSVETDNTWSCREQNHKNTKH